MKTITTLFLILSFSLSLKSQQFLSADSYDISNCNEVAALDVDSDGNIFIAGVHDAPYSLPYRGNAYFQKTDANGEVLWIEDLTGTLIIGDMATVGNRILMIGQSNGAFTYKGTQYGQGQYFMFVMMFDADGNVEWYFTDETKYGANTVISVGNTENIALYVRGQYNIDDWILIIDESGNILKSRLLAANKTLIVDMAYFDDKIYLNGGFNGPGNITIDTILIELPPIENASITLGLDENLVAKWLYVDQTFNNRDGRIVADESGVFVYEDILEPPFISVASLKKFDFEGNLQTEIEVPVFTNNISLYPDMMITPTTIGLFAQNDFEFTSHKVMLFDHELNLLTEKVIDGPSDLYSGQIASHGEDVFVAHVFSGDLNFDDELTLTYNAVGKLPYIAKIGEPEVTSIENGHVSEVAFSVYPNPANEIITVRPAENYSMEGSFIISDLKGNVVSKGVLTQNSNSINVSRLPAGVYFLKTSFIDGITRQEKFVVR